MPAAAKACASGMCVWVKGAREERSKAKAGDRLTWELKRGYSSEREVGASQVLSAVERKQQSAWDQERWLWRGEDVLPSTLPLSPSHLSTHLHTFPHLPVGGPHPGNACMLGAGGPSRSQPKPGRASSAAPTASSTPAHKCGWRRESVEAHTSVGAHTSVETDKCAASQARRLIGVSKPETAWKQPFQPHFSQCVHNP